MGDVEKIPLKRAELSVRKFNEVAVPHHLGLLKNHKSNIEKCLALGDWSKIKKEEINALRVVKQLKNLMLEMDALRSKVKDDEVDKFDAMMTIGRKQALEGIREFMDLQLKSPSTASSIESAYETDSEVIGGVPQIQIQADLREQQLRAREACLEEVKNLHREVEDLHEIFRDVSGMVQEQGESVEIITDHAEEAFENVVNGEMNLRQALKYKKTLYPMIGAVLGTCVGGPIGLIAGLKAGGLAAIGCGILGFTGGSVLKMNNVTPGIEEKKEE